MSRLSEAGLREEICRLGNSMFSRGLTFGSAGNISVRLEDGWLMTPTNVSLGRLDPARLAKLDAAGRLISGDPPTKESFLHRAMYEERREAHAVVHLHSTHSVAVSALADVDADDVLPPITAYYVMRVGRLPLVPYHPPGDPSLGGSGEEASGKASRGPARQSRTGGRGQFARRRRQRDRGTRGDGEAVPPAPRLPAASAHARAGRRAQALLTDWIDKPCRSSPPISA